VTRLVGETLKILKFCLRQEKWCTTTAGDCLHLMPRHLYTRMFFGLISHGDSQRRALLQRQVLHYIHCANNFN
jgi:hypothetical protein